MEKTKVFLDEKLICDEYLNTTIGVESLASKYHVGKLKIKDILFKNGIEIKKRGKQALNETFVVNDYHIKKYVNGDNYHYIIKDKANGEIISTDVDNLSGFLTTYIRHKYEVETPTLYDRRMYYMRTGNYWWEQWLEYEKIDNSKTKKCPYCDWETIDINNRSGAFEQHLNKVHGISKELYMNEHPEDKGYFSLVDHTKNLQFEENEDKFVTCKICGKKLSRIGNQHLQKHGITKEEYIQKFGSSGMISKDYYEKTVEKIYKLNTEHDFTKQSSDELEIIDSITDLGYECKPNRKILDGLEIDMFVVGTNICFEYDGLRWHSEKYGKDKTYHINKTKICAGKNYDLYHIFEDEYNMNKDVIFNRIKTILGVKSNQICISNDECNYMKVCKDNAESFIKQYTSERSKICDFYFGAYKNGELVALQAYIQNGNNLELKYCVTNYNYRLKNVHKDLFQYSLNNIDVDIDSVVAYADRRWVLDYKKSIFAQIGMNYSQTCEPRCTYYNSKVSRYNRYEISEFNKQHLCETYNQPTDLSLYEILINIGYDRIWDCGYFEYKYPIKK